MPQSFFFAFPRKTFILKACFISIQELSRNKLDKFRENVRIIFERLLKINC
jgi:hypothetical protein